MEGDLTSNMGTYSPEAGIIPRTLYRLFHTLELSRDEYSVHASFVELYNEELRDLLSNDAPQPLGGGANSTGLRMYEDSKGRGVVIQGLEDTPMKDAEHGLALLRKGSQKRQIAATKCNESSSRSHSVFSLTIHIKETTSKGEDVLRTGKLNLVDLAGSENIGRSGAENKRAREAGMINQSLLTLGRVINALVEKSSHVPYRESKLTRLLQESLGGRTKTCIIATVSSEKNNMEETLSTLDYALRAKSIRNRPEVNQRMTRAALIKEYVHEIERLKGDLLASREKNGIYLSPESWTLMQDEHELVKGQVEELRRNGEVVESKMISLKEQFEQNMQLLIKRDNEIKNVKAEFKEKEEEFQQIKPRMDELRKAEAEERILREAYMRNEKKLNSIAVDLQNVVKESTGDVNGLFAKLDRKTKVEKRNRDLIVECQASLTSMSNQLEARVIEFASNQDQFTLDLSAQLQEFRQREEDKLKNNREFVFERINELQALAKESGEEQKSNKRSVDGLVDDIRKKTEALVSVAEDRNEELRQVCQRLTMKVVQSNKESLVQVKQSMEEMADMLLISLRYSRDQLTQDRKSLEDVQSITQDAMQKELTKTKEQNTRLQMLLQDEKEKSNTMREKLIKNIGQMLVNFTQERQDSIEMAFTEIQQNNNASHDQIQVFTQSHAIKVESLLDSNRTWKENIKEREKAAKAQKIRFEAGVNQGNSQLEVEMQSVAIEICGGSSGALQDLQETIKDVQGDSIKMRETMESARQAQEKQLEEMKSSAEEGYSTIEGELQSTLEDVQETCEGVVEGVQDHCAVGSAFLQESVTQIISLRDNTRDYLSSKIQSDVPTNSTPQKREYHGIRARWSLVSSNRRKALLQERKRKLANDENGSSGSISVAFTDESDSNQEEEVVESERDGRGGGGFYSDFHDDEDLADETLTKDRIAEAKRPIKRASIAISHHHHHHQAPPSSIPLRETNSNRLSMARGGGGSNNNISKTRQPSGLPQMGSTAKRQRH